MPHKTDWKGWIATVIAVCVFFGGIAGGVFRMAVAGRIAEVEKRETALEIRTSALETGQEAQNRQWTDVQHDIKMHLLSIDMNMSNVFQLLYTHTVKLEKIGDGRSY